MWTSQEPKKSKHMDFNYLPAVLQASLFGLAAGDIETLKMPTFQEVISESNRFYFGLADFSSKN